MVDREDGARSGAGPVVDVLEEGRGSAGSEFGVGERRFLGGLESGGGHSGRGSVESFGSGVAGGWKVTAGELGGLIRALAEDRWRHEELIAGEVQDLSTRISGLSAECERASRDGHQVEESSSRSVERGRRG